LDSYPENSQDWEAEAVNGGEALWEERVDRGLHIQGDWKAEDKETSLEPHPSLEESLAI
jgi:hypothetical protein